MNYTVSGEVAKATSEYLPLYSEYAAKFDDLIAQMNEESLASTEGLNSNFVGRFLVGVFDTFGALLSSVGTNLTRFTKALKRSELHEYCAGNRAKLFVVERIEFTKAYGVNVDIPANMHGGYKSAVSKIQMIYNRLNAINTMKMMDASFKNIFKAMTGDTSRLNDLINTTGDIAGRTTTAVKPAVLECQKEFSSKFIAQKPFEQVFASIKELSEVKTMLLDLEPRLQDCHQLVSLVESMERSQKGILSAYREDIGLTQKELNTLAEMSKNVALLFDAYGMAAMRQMAMEHNLVLCCNTLYDKCK